MLAPCPFLTCDDAMKSTLLLSSAALLASLPLRAQQPRDPNHPLPPTAATIESTVPQLPTSREAAAPPAVLPAPAAVHPAVPQRRSSPRPDASVGPVLDRVLFDRPTAGGALWAMGSDWKASFDSAGFQFIPFFGSQAPRNFPLRVELDQVTVGGEPIVLAPGEPEQHGFAVRTARGGLTEVVDTSLRSVEQSWVFATLPNRGEIAVEVRIDGEFTAEASADGLRFRNEFGAVSYEKAVAVDAAGAQITLPIRWTGTEAHILVPATFVAKAQLPLVVDPLLSSVSGIGTGASAAQLQRDADVATIQSVDRRCVTWRRQWSATDQDCWGQVFDGTLTAVAPAFTIDFTGLDWLAPAVAGNDYSQGFLVVSEVRIGTLYYIAGRLITAAGAVNGLQFDIERDGVVGLPGNNFRPDVGGDFYPGAAAYYAVVFEKEVAAGNRDIYVKLVRQDGILLTTNPSVIDSSTTDESNPCISKQDGGAETWFVAYQRTWPGVPFDQEVLGKFVFWTGTVQAPNPYIAGFVANETAPCTSSPVLVEGAWYYMVCHETDFGVTGGQRDILCKVYDINGNQVTSLNLNQAEQGGTYQAYDQQHPDCDGDGIRFVVGYTDPWGGTFDFETHVSTLAYLTTPPTLRIDDDRIGLGLSVADEFGTRICSQHSGGGQSSSRFAVSHANFGPNTIELFDYGGWQSGTQFSVYPSSCGAPVSITPTGSSAVGGTVTITVQHGPLSGTVFGFPGFIPLNPICNCILGVQSGLLLGNPLVFTVPPNPVYVGITLSVQGWTVLGSNCFGFIDLSDTIDFTIR